jgi:anti-sigma-K factor RskA
MSPVRTAFELMPVIAARTSFVRACNSDRKEIWSPIPAGVFKPDAEGNATVVNSRLPKGVETKTFAITVEPEDGSQLPTSTPIMLGTGG